MSTNSLHILFGFNDAELTGKLCDYLAGKGYVVTVEEKYTKFSIKEYINAHPECDTVILKEAWGELVFKAEEVAELADLRDINIIIVVGAEHKGTQYMHTLYAAGITSALFHVGRKGGIKLGTIAELIIKKRPRKEARVYYGIADEQIELGYLAFDAYIEYADALNNKEYGRTLIERFMTVAGKLTPKQLEDYIKRLPTEVVEELQQYETYYKIIITLKQYGIDLRYKKPKKFKEPLLVPEEKICIENNKENAPNDAYSLPLFEFGDEEDDDDTFSSAFYEELAPQTNEPKKKDVKKKEKGNKSFIIVMSLLVTIIVALLILLCVLIIKKDAGRDSVCDIRGAETCCMEEIYYEKESVTI